MEERYNNYMESFNNLDINEKRDYILSNLEELNQLFTKINTDFQKSNYNFISNSNYETEEEFLTYLFSRILSLKESGANTINIILDNFYSGGQNE